MSQRLPVAYSYRRGYKATTRKNDDPEHKYQVSVAGYLKWALPTDIIWTASAAGMRAASMATAVKMKEAGQHRGWGDIQLLCPDGVTRYVELKWDSVLTPEQIAFRDHLQAIERRTGLKMWALSRKTLEQMERALIYFGITPRISWEKANRYGVIIPD